MNTFSKTIILSVTALAAIASTVDIASAGDRYWRQHHGRHWKQHAVIAGVTAGVVLGTIVANRPRVVYRDDPVVVDETPDYDEGTVYLDPDTEYDGGTYRDDAPEDEEYAAPSDNGDDSGYEEERSTGADDGYFPERPQASTERRRSSVTRNSDVKRVPLTRSKAVPSEEANAVALKPWSREWKAWCAGQFSSFNPQNGTYLGYDKKRHFCKAG